MALLHNVFLCNVRERWRKRKKAEMWGLIKKVLRPHRKKKKRIKINQKTDPPKGDFQLLTFPHKPIWKSGPALRCEQKRRNLSRLSGR